MKLSHQKLKMMYLAKILMEQTDEEHTITVPEMIAELSKLGISAERKSIYSDIEGLRNFGIDIIGEKEGKTFNYYLSDLFQNKTAISNSVAKEMAEESGSQDSDVILAYMMKSVGVA